MEFLNAHQLNIMMFMSGICGVLAFCHAFPGWEEWKNRLRLGMDCRIDIQRDPRVITVLTENVGISIRSEISIHDFDGEVYAALTGDQCTITEIRIVRCPGGA